ncbi:response regulator [Microbacterium gorillae]|uniref:response regulator n=1 Tax=Microbacterium gorillae TaxID=1231063 RepID=UPI003D990041
MISLLIVDDQPLIRNAIRGLLRVSGDIDVVAEGADGIEAVHLAREHRPDVVLMDIRMPHLGGIEATEQICADPDLGATRVLILTTFEEDEYVLAALRAGASGFIGKAAEPDEIARAVRAISAGESLLSPVATRALIERHLRVDSVATLPATDSTDLGQLTLREREVLQLIGHGLSNQQIAERFVISPLTVKTHINRIMSKLDARDRAQLVIRAYESGLVVPGSGR